MTTPEHVYVFAPEPAYPLDTGGLDGWSVVKTVLHLTGARDSDGRQQLVHEHHVMPPQGPMRLGDYQRR